MVHIRFKNKTTVDPPLQGSLVHEFDYGYTGFNIGASGGSHNYLLGVSGGLSGVVLGQKPNLLAFAGLRMATVASGSYFQFWKRICGLLPKSRSSF